MSEALLQIVTPMGWLALAVAIVLLLEREFVDETKPKPVTKPFTPDTAELHRN